MPPPRRRGARIGRGVSCRTRAVLPPAPARAHDLVYRMIGPPPSRGQVLRPDLNFLKRDVPQTLTPPRRSRLASQAARGAVVIGGGASRPPAPLTAYQELGCGC